MFEKVSLSKLFIIDFLVIFVLVSLLPNRIYPKKIEKNLSRSWVHLKRPGEDVWWENPDVEDLVRLSLYKTWPVLRHIMFKMDFLLILIFLERENNEKNSIFCCHTNESQSYENNEGIYCWNLRYWPISAESFGHMNASRIMKSVEAMIITKKTWLSVSLFSN